MSVLLCDVGGTHVRLAIGQEGKLYTIKKFQAADFKALDDVVHFYFSMLTERPTKMYLATAAREDGDKWIFTNQNKWIIRTEEFKTKFAFTEFKCINDFEANALGVVVAKDMDLQAFVENPARHDDQYSKCVIGVGTGLGLAYIMGKKDTPIIQQTFGGHMLPVTRTEEQSRLFKFISKRKEKPSVDIYEDALSGLGLFRIYEFLCSENHLDREFHSVADLMLRGHEHALFLRALDLFFELLGLFAHQAVAFGYSYNGLYLTGGIIDRLVLGGHFRADKFFSAFNQNNIPIVKNAVTSTPVYWLKDEFISLKGLYHLSGNSHA